MAKSLDAEGGAAEVTIEVKLKIGSITELGFGGLKQGWVASDREGLQFDLTAGAGLGNPLMEATVTDGDDCLYAYADAHQFAPLIWNAIVAELRKRQANRDGGGDGDSAPADG